MSDFNIDLFEKYTQNLLSDSERLVFEKQLQEDSDLSSEFETFKTLKAGIRSNVLNEKLSMLKAHAATSSDSNNLEEKPSPSWSKYLLYAALSLLVIGLIAYFSNKNSDVINEKTLDSVQEVQTTENQPEVQKDLNQVKVEKIDSTTDLMKNIKKAMPEKTVIIKKQPKRKEIASIDAVDYKKAALALYDAPKSLAILLRNSETSSVEAYENALELFNNKKYDEALKILNEWDNPKSQYLKAHCLFLSGKSSEAADIFRDISTDDFSEFHIDAGKYLALALLADYPRSKEELDILIKNGAEDPRKLLENLQENK